MNENESLTVTLTLENNEELECAVLNIFEAEEKEYIALLPLDENGDNTDGQIYLYRFIDNGEEEEPDLRTSKKMKNLTVFPLYSTNGWIHRISAISILMH